MSKRQNFNKLNQQHNLITPTRLLSLLLLEGGHNPILKKVNLEEYMKEATVTNSIITTNIILTLLLKHKTNSFITNKKEMQDLLLQTKSTDSAVTDIFMIQH